MRTILSGASLPDYLALRILPPKLLGVLLLGCSGFWVGREGPMIHLACLIGSALMRLPLFRQV